MIDLAAILASLDGVVAVGGSRWKARCPCHPDRAPSLSVRVMGDGLVACHCFGCGAGTRAVVQRLGVEGLSVPPRTEIAPDPWQNAWRTLCRDVLRRHASFWQPQDARLLLNTELLADGLSQMAGRISAAATSLPPTLEATWDLVARAADLEHEARLLRVALG